MTTDERLEPCPFCGDDAMAGWFAGEANVACTSPDCPGAHGASAYLAQHEADKDEAMSAAVAEWNRRADLPRPEDAARIAELEAENATIEADRDRAQKNYAAAMMAVRRLAMPEAFGPDGAILPGMMPAATKAAHSALRAALSPEEPRHDG